MILILDWLPDPTTYDPIWIRLNWMMNVQHIPYEKQCRLTSVCNLANDGHVENSLEEYMCLMFYGLHRKYLHVFWDKMLCIKLSC